MLVLALHTPGSMASVDESVNFFSSSVDISFAVPSLLPFRGQ